MADKAAIFGINEYKNVNSLRGCVNDVENMRSLLTSVFGFEPGNVRTFVNNKVTKSEVTRQMKWLFRDVGAGDRVVFHFSGHGSQTVNLDGDEEDGADELICLYDMDFDDPETYLIDDEIREWTKGLPADVLLTIIFDSCHSGTATRMFVSPEVNKPHKSMCVDATATLKRSIAAAGMGASGIEMAAAALDPMHDDLVRARFVDPPQATKDAIAKQKRARAAEGAGSRTFVKAELNHVLLAACKDNQTAADATIESRPNGAFTFYLCKTLRSTGPNVERQPLIDLVIKALAAGHFSQAPQLEAPIGSGPLFGTKRGAAPAASTTPVPMPVVSASSSPDDERHRMLDLLSRIVGGGGTLEPAAQKQALDILSRIVGAAPIAALAAAPARELAGRFLIPVHGICQHLRGYSNPWWDALHPWTNAYRRRESR